MYACSSDQVPYECQVLLLKVPYWQNWESYVLSIKMIHFYRKVPSKVFLLASSLQHVKKKTPPHNLNIKTSQSSGSHKIQGSIPIPETLRHPSTTQECLKLKTGEKSDLLNPVFKSHSFALWNKDSIDKSVWFLILLMAQTQRLVQWQPWGSIGLVTLARWMMFCGQKNFLSHEKWEG